MSQLNVSILILRILLPSTIVLFVLCILLMFVRSIRLIRKAQKQPSPFLIQQGTPRSA